MAGGPGPTIAKAWVAKRGWPARMQYVADVSTLLQTMCGNETTSVPDGLPVHPSSRQMQRYTAMAANPASP